MNQTKKIAIFDLDGTLIENHLWIGILKSQFKERRNIFWSFWYLISHMAVFPLWKMKLVSTEKFYQDWIKDLPQMVKGMKVEEGESILKKVAENYLLPSAKKEVIEKLKEHQKNGVLTVLASSSFQNLVEIVAKNLNIDFALGTELEISGNKFTGQAILPLCFKEGKIEKIEKFLSEKNLKVDLKESFAYSDSSSDLPILNWVGNPVAVNPDKKLLNIAKEKKWQII